MEIISSGSGSGGAVGGLMAVFAVSGSVVFLSVQAHKRLLADFLAKMDSQIIQNPSGGVLKIGEAKKVRFAGDMVAAEKVHWKKHPAGNSRRKTQQRQGLEDMPQNWQVMYKGILQNRNYRMS